MIWTDGQSLFMSPKEKEVIPIKLFLFQLYMDFFLMTIFKIRMSFFYYYYT